MSTIIVPEVAQRRIDREAREEEWRTRVFTHPQWHSDEAKEAWANRKPTPAGITAVLMNADWFALGYDAAVAALKAKWLRDVGFSVMSKDQLKEAFDKIEGSDPTVMSDAQLGRAYSDAMEGE